MSVLLCLVCFVHPQKPSHSGSQKTHVFSSGFCFWRFTINDMLLGKVIKYFGETAFDSCNIERMRFLQKRHIRAKGSIVFLQIYYKNTLCCIIRNGDIETQKARKRFLQAMDTRKIPLTASSMCTLKASYAKLFCIVPDGLKMCIKIVNFRL